MSQWQTICTNLDTLLKTITVANGYTTDGGLNVEEDPETPLAHSVLPAYAWTDNTGSTSDDEEIGRLIHTMNFDVEACASGSGCRATVRGMLSDVVTALGLDEQLSGSCYRINITGRAIGSSQSEKKIANGTLSIEVIYRTAPFTI